MEEKETTTSKLTYEQLEQAAIQLQKRAMMAESKLMGIDTVSMRLTWLFKALENKESFSAEFISKSIKEIEEILTLDNNTTEEKAKEE